MSESNLCILANKKPGEADAIAPVGIPGSELRVSVGKQVLRYFRNIRGWAKF